MEATALFRSFKPFNHQFFHSISFTTRSSIKFHTGENKLLKRTYDGLLLDAGGTLLQLANPVEEVYADIGRKYGLRTSVAEIKQGFRRAFSGSWPQKLRYQGDGKPFWKLVVSEATGCDDDNYFEEVYKYYANANAWHLPDGALENMMILKDSGDQLNVEAGRSVHVGDDEITDKAGSNAVGINCWLWGKDVNDFSQLTNRILVADK